MDLQVCQSSNYSDLLQTSLLTLLLKYLLQKRKPWTERSACMSIQNYCSIHEMLFIYKYLKNEQKHIFNTNQENVIII